MKNILLAATTLVLSSLSAYAAEFSEPPVKVSISKSITSQSGPAPSVTVQVTLTAKSPSKARLRVFTNSENGTPVADNFVAEQIVTVGQSLTIPVQIPIQADGDFELEAIAEKVEGSQSGGATVVIRTSKEATSLYSPAEYAAIRGPELKKEKRGLGFQHPQPASLLQSLSNMFPSKTEPEFLVGGGKMKTSTPPKNGVLGSSKMLALSGTVTTRFNNTTVPMANVQVQIWDSDTLSPDDLLGTTTTDENGRYSISVENDDGPFGGGVDVYLYLSSKVGNVAELQLIPDGEGGYVPFYYAWRSQTVDDITDPSRVIDFQIQNSPQAAAVWTGTARGSFLAQQSKHQIPYVEVRYPGFGSGTYFTPGTGLINIDSEYNSPVVAGHEYAHAVMYNAYGSIPGEGGMHGFCEPASPGLAWSEGFATFYGLNSGLGNGTMHWAVGDTGRSIEHFYCNRNDMSTDEGRVAAGLWDLFDPQNDNNQGDPNLGRTGFSDANGGAQLVPFDALVGALWKSNQQNTQQYWNDLKTGLNQSQLAPSVEIMNFNYFSNP